MARLRSNRITEIGELQLHVFDLLCKLSEATVYDVLEQFPEQQRPRYSTVLTVLRTLEKKGLATHRTEGRTYVFRPAVEAGEVRRQVLRDVVHRVFGGSPRAMVAALLGDETIGDEALGELRALIADPGDEKNGD